MAGIPAPATTEFGNLLQNEVIKIFSYLTLEERQEIRGVSRTWRAIVEEAFGLKVRIRNSTSDLITSCPHAIHVELSSMTIPFDNPQISFAQTLQTLCFSKIVVTYNLISFLRACPQISHLIFVNIVLDQPIADPWSTYLRPNETIPLSSLETLELKCFSFIEGVLEIFGFLNEKITFGNLREVLITVQNPPVIPLHVLFARSYNPVTTHPLIQLLRRNRPSLRKFVMGRSTLPVLIKLYAASEAEQGAPQNETTGLPPPQLEHLEIHPYFREEWSPLLRGQVRIKVMNLGSCNVSRWGEIQQAILANAATLESFSVGGLSFGHNWDCSIFQTCFALKHLSVEISHSAKVNLAAIPHQLKSLHLFGPVSKAEMMSMTETLFELEDLKFTHVGKIAEFVGGGDEDKVTLDVFKTLIQMPKLRKLSLVACSSISVDWDGIVRWCGNVSKTSRDFQYQEKFYQLHGEYFRNGIIVDVQEGFPREDLAWTDEPITYTDTDTTLAIQFV